MSHHRREFVRLIFTRTKSSELVNRVFRCFSPLGMVVMRWYGGVLVALVVWCWCGGMMVWYDGGVLVWWCGDSDVVVCTGNGGGNKW